MTQHTSNPLRHFDIDAFVFTVRGVPEALTTEQLSRYLELTRPGREVPHELLASVRTMREAYAPGISAWLEVLETPPSVRIGTAATMLREAARLESITPHGGDALLLTAVALAVAEMRTVGPSSFQQ